ncbi:polysaccharide deacetylase family protein [Salinarimonas soli]|uniref:Chitooligosaccharide deacetylase n=1 Tax=Salinarimonas soli TaxID=1638099 RepID=A0A5B2V9S7_9HYPH|nr:polysaccharide deacetylase family protein [Salinarimonas soli]KAA2235606.1 polysaccharide deacetylase family protein [Salinarimonas soli]
MGLRRRAIGAALTAIGSSGADRALAPLLRGRGVILTGHHVRPWRETGFAPNRLLEITPDFLDRALTLLARQGFELVSMDEVPDRLARGGRPFAALTFDDGYRDNVEHALPVLRRHGAPAAFYVTADYAEGRGRLWWLELEEAIRRLDRVVLTVGGRRLDLPAGTDAAKAAAYEAVYWPLRTLPEDALRAAIAGLCREAGVDAGALVQADCLTFEEIAALSREPGVTIGAHTLTHPRLATLDESEARREIAASGIAVEARIGRPVRHFAYPVGDPGSAGPRDFALAREAGFVTAVTTRPGHVFPEHAAHLHALPRVSLNGLHQTEGDLRVLLSGVPFWLWNRGRRLNVS